MWDECKLERRFLPSNSLLWDRRQGTTLGVGTTKDILISRVAFLISAMNCAIRPVLASLDFIE